jgi:hypothetical protein
LLSAGFSALAGFTLGGWLLSSKAESIAEARVTKAVLVALAPICAQKFNASDDRSAKLAQLREKNEWDRVVFIEEGGWAKTSESSVAPQGVARACAELIVAGKEKHQSRAGCQLPGQGMRSSCVEFHKSDS